MILTKFKLNDGTEYFAEAYVDGHLINPRFSPESVPETPFIIHAENIFSVHALVDGYTLCVGVFDNLNDALYCAKYRPI